MADSEGEQIAQANAKFIELANTMKDEGLPTKVISAGLMTASTVYVTYVLAGNEGVLNQKGIDEVVYTYRQQLSRFQDSKREQLEKPQNQA
ncbi:MAG: DUF3144 domain-containing protein [Halieaceae bacterium]